MSDVKRRYNSLKLDFCPDTLFWNQFHSDNIDAVFKFTNQYAHETTKQFYTFDDILTISEYFSVQGFASIVTRLNKKKNDFDILVNNTYLCGSDKLCDFLNSK